MPIAGNNVEALPLEIIDGKLIVGAKTRVSSDMACDALVAVEKLLAGEKVHLRLYGLNYVMVGEALYKRGIVT